MDLPTDVFVHCPLMGLKNGRAQLIRIHDHGYFELVMKFGERDHRTLLPIANTALIQQQAEDPIEDLPQVEIER